ncbi:MULTISPECIES: Fic family protein [Fructobacillus]|uniref:Fic family protein n=1 Tax=Fructobacillus TaxID=559173 RepID=UPI00064DC665|nr:MULTISPECIES: Fic family protein [Fructobacillus]KMK53654.1 Fic/DOC family protein [Fructobacillus sp. EFB-N1]MCK8627024.1 Fic family protein [Fructobacillus cardui]
MAYQTKQFHFDLETELLLFHKSTPTILHDGAQFEGMPVTLLQTEAIANNDYITGVRPLEIVTLHRMHEGAQFVAQNYQNFDFQSLLALHKIVGNGDALNPGMLRTGMGGVNTNKGLFIPDKVVPEIVEKQFNTIVNNRDLAPENRAAKIFTYLSRSQIFNDTNKRTALLTANVPLLQEGAGVFYIPEPAMDNILHMMGNFYYSNDDRLLVATLKEIAVSDYDGKTFYDPSHQNEEYARDYKRHLNAFKGLGSKGVLGKETVKRLTSPELTNNQEQEYLSELANQQENNLNQ